MYKVSPYHTYTLPLLWNAREPGETFCGIQRTNMATTIHCIRRIKRCSNRVGLLQLQQCRISVNMFAEILRPIGLQFRLLKLSLSLIPSSPLCSHLATCTAQPFRRHVGESEGMRHLYFYCNSRPIQWSSNGMSGSACGHIVLVSVGTVQQ